ncbi:hypothetical protein HYD44_00840 [Mycoplasmopsis bovis]|nr:hypothetical protein HYD44_00840 [Mycoplasmopsis bovis]
MRIWLKSNTIDVINVTQIVESLDYQRLEKTNSKFRMNRLTFVSISSK